MAVSALAGVAHAAGDKGKGAELFEDRCAMCHLAGGGGQGPSLKGVVGRKAGSAKQGSYTPALKAAQLVWTPDNLDRFLTDPGKLVPGTAMPVRITNPAQRADIISYLSTVK